MRPLQRPCLRRQFRRRRPRQKIAPRPEARRPERRRCRRQHLRDTLPRRQRLLITPLQRQQFLPAFARPRPRLRERVRPRPHRARLARQKRLQVRRVFFTMRRIAFRESREQRRFFARVSPAEFAQQFLKFFTPSPRPRPTESVQVPRHFRIVLVPHRLHAFQQQETPPRLAVINVAGFVFFRLILQRLRVNETRLVVQVGEQHRERVAALNREPRERARRLRRLRGRRRRRALMTPDISGERIQHRVNSERPRRGASASCRLQKNFYSRRSPLRPCALLVLLTIPQKYE